MPCSVKGAKNVFKIQGSTIMSPEPMNSWPIWPA